MPAARPPAALYLLDLEQAGAPAVVGRPKLLRSQLSQATWCASSPAWPAGWIESRPPCATPSRWSRWCSRGICTASCGSSTLPAQPAQTGELATLSAFFHTGTGASRKPVPLFLHPPRKRRRAQRRMRAGAGVSAGGSAGGLVARRVVVGTGKLVEPADVESTAVQTLYLIPRRRFARFQQRRAVGGRCRSRGPEGRQLGRQRVFGGAGGAGLRRGAAGAGAGVGAGWYFDFPAAGERLAGPARMLPVAVAVLECQSPEPRGLSAADCRVPDGAGFRCLLDADAGPGPSIVQQVRLLPQACCCWTCPNPRRARGPTAPGAEPRRSCTPSCSKARIGYRAQGAALELLGAGAVPARGTPAGLLCTQVDAGRLSSARRRRLRPATRGSLVAVVPLPGRCTTGRSTRRAEWKNTGAAKRSASTRSSSPPAPVTALPCAPQLGIPRSAFERLHDKVPEVPAQQAISENTNAVAGTHGVMPAKAAPSRLATSMPTAGAARNGNCC